MTRPFYGYYYFKGFDLDLEVSATFQKLQSYFTHTHTNRNLSSVNSWYTIILTASFISKQYIAAVTSIHCTCKTSARYGPKGRTNKLIVCVCLKNKWLIVKFSISNSFCKTPLYLVYIFNFLYVYLMISPVKIISIWRCYGIDKASQNQSCNVMLFQLQKAFNYWFSSIGRS